MSGALHGTPPTLPANRIGVTASDDDGVLVEHSYAVPQMGMPHPQVRIAMTVRCALQTAERIREALAETVAAPLVRDYADELDGILAAILGALDGGEVALSDELRALVEQARETRGRYAEALVARVEAA